MQKGTFPLQNTTKKPQVDQKALPIVDALKSIRNELHEDLLKQHSLNDFLKDIPAFFDKVVEEVAKKTETIDSLNRELRDYASIKNRLEEYEKRIQICDSIMRDKEKEVESLKATNNKMFEEIDALNKKNRDLEYKITDLNGRCEDMAKLTKKGENELEKVRREHDKALSALTEKYESERRELEQKNKKSLGDLKDTIDDLTKENKELADSIRGYQDELKKLSKIQMEKKAIQEEHNKLTINFEEQKKKYLKENVDLQNDLAESERVIEHQRKVIEDLKNELKEAEAEYEDVDRALKEKDTQLSDRSAKLKKLGSEVQQMVQKIVDMNKLSDRLIQENEGLKRELQRTARPPSHKGGYEFVNNYSQQQYVPQNVSVNWQ